MKFNGRFLETIPDNSIKQIAGRAGRYRTAIEAQDENENRGEPINGDNFQNLLNPTTTQNLGLVTTLNQSDLPRIIQGMQSKPKPIMSAGILPPVDVVLHFASCFPPNTSFSYILLRLHKLSLIHPRFHLCALGDMLRIADIIHAVPNLSIRDRITFIAAPVGNKDSDLDQFIRTLARCVADNESGALLDIREIKLSVLLEHPINMQTYLERLETLHKMLIVYLWMSYRFLGVFTSQPTAFYVKELVEARINTVLEILSTRSNIREGNVRDQSKIHQHTAMLEELGRQIRLGDLGFLQKKPGQLEPDRLPSQISENSIIGSINKPSLSFMNDI